MSSQSAKKPLPTRRLELQAERLQRRVRLIRIKQADLNIEKHLIEMELAQVLLQIEKRRKGIA